MGFVSVPPLTETFGWRGKTYLPGSQQIPEDLAIALGLTASDSEEADGAGGGIPQPWNAETALPVQGDDLDVAPTRTDELNALYDTEGWDAIRAIAEEHSIPKPSNGWKHAIPLIVEAEQKQ
ncbi:MAG: hypothetical protein AAFY20_21835 [Cyanobacteria bacterium J06639_14]